MTFARYQNKLPRSALTIKGFWQSGKRVETALELDGNTWQVFFESDDLPPEPAWEALLPMTVLVGMRNASSLQVGHAIDSALLGHLPAIQQRLAASDPLFHPIPIQADTPAPATAAHPSRVGHFFSGGIDSWYSLLVHQDEVTDLVWVSGADIPLDNSAHLQKSIDLVKRVANRFGKRLVTIRTNMRTFTDRFVPWHIYLDHFMQSPAHLLRGDFSRMYLASALTSANLLRYGLDPAVTDLWSSSTLQVVYDCLEVDRLHKTARVAEEDFALQNLRVCWQNPVEGLNCGVCEKCQRTMINLEAAGALERCTVFNHPLDLKLVARDFIKDDNQLFNTQMNLEAITRKGNLPLARALQRSIRSSVWKRIWQRLKEGVKGRLRRLRRVLRGGGAWRAHR
jgi:hypothetical protein